MRKGLAMAVLGLVALQVPFEVVDVPDHATGRVIIRGDLQIVTRHVGGVFEVVRRQRTGAAWGEPIVLFAAPPSHFAMASSLSPDGRRVYLETNVRRPQVTGRDDSDAWVIDRSGTGWGAAEPLGDAWATPFNEHAMSVAADGTACLNSARPGGLGENDILCSRSLDEPPTFVPTLNSSADDAFAVLAAGGDVIVFASNRDIGLGGWDLYAARRSAGGWAAPVNLGAAVNSSADELHPWLDGDSLVFVRTTSTTREVLRHRSWQAPR